MNRTTATEHIALAFAGVTRDAERSLRQAQLCDRGMSAHPASSAEWRQAGELDVEFEWHEVPGSALDACDAALSHLIPVNWRFYLPAYLCRSLELFVGPTFESSMLRSVIFHLTWPTGEDVQEYSSERFDTLNPDQCAAVKSFLECVRDEALLAVEATNQHWGEHEDAKIALESYWNRFGA